MLAKIGLMKVFSQLLSLPASAEDGPTAAASAGWDILARPGAEPFWKVVERLAPGGNVQAAVERLVQELSSTTSREDFLAIDSPIRAMLVSLAPESAKKMVDVALVDYVENPKGFSDMVEASLNPSEMISSFTKLVAPVKLYRCAGCDMPFKSSKSVQDISCPHCEFK